MMSNGSDQLRAGDKVGPYRIEGLLGEGGMGLVYRARDGEGNEVALKMIRAKLASDERFRKRFQREAVAASRVEHRNIVPILGQGDHEGIPYLAQRYIAGGTLADRLGGGAAMPVEEVVRVLDHAAAGLEAVHAEGVVHRDVKPANIMLDETGTAYITDFGLAKQSDASVLTMPGQAVGSLDYMAPEQIRGEEVNACTDVYALGCVAVECLTGNPPFGDRKGMQVLWAHLQDAPPDPAQTNAEVSEELSWAVLKALEKDPSERPPTPLAYSRMMKAAVGSRAVES
jgi:serine/threonine-protein kinase